MDIWLITLSVKSGLTSQVASPAACISGPVVVKLRDVNPECMFICIDFQGCSQAMSCGSTGLCGKWIKSY